MKRWKKIVALIVLGLGMSAAHLSMDLKVKGAQEESIPAFNDISRSFAAEAINDLYKRKIMEGTGPGIFSPKKAITRAESMTALFRLLALEPSAGGIPVFQDTPKGTWYYGYVQAGAYLGLAQGQGTGKYLPNEGVARQELAVWLTRFLKQKAGSGNPGSLFRDAGDIAPWAASDVYTVQRMGLMEGANGRFRPADIVTREEMAVIMDRMITKKAWEQQISASPAEPIQLGWQYGQTAEEFKASVSRSAVNVISPRWYFLENNGAMSDKTDPTLVAWAKATGRKVWAMAGNRSNADVTHDMLSDSNQAKETASALAAYAKKYNLDGLNLDFENVLPKDRKALTAFVADLAAKLHRNGDMLSVCVSPDLGSDWTAAFDYAALARSADYLVLMGYDEHWGSAPDPGPVASLPWVKSALEKLLNQTEPEKVILGMPLYNRDWSVKADGSTFSSEDITLTEQIERIGSFGMKPVWNASLGQYVSSYTQSRVLHRLWFEDARSLTLKYRMAAGNNIAGFAYWSIGGESEGIWEALNNASRFDNYTF
ncbi:S-layer homology domain-containing protein [Paenibacillus caui]|uniref:S-layer homology domain-containing protein n=1 Tax=Paenibacillus caui TaxID=2873927 RepID=UPI001CAA3AD5|nr:S-layer homology domain-containing protein [Paenibacillus caui]